MHKCTGASRPKILQAYNRPTKELIGREGELGFVFGQKRPKTGQKPATLFPMQ
jgi:hypothetical protein